jgi:hypothetical protein
VVKNERRREEEIGEKKMSLVEREIIMNKNWIGMVRLIET